MSFLHSSRVSDLRPSGDRSRSSPDSRIANDAEIREARELYARMRQTIQPEQELFTLLTASRTNSGIREAITQGQVATRPDEQGDTFQAQLMEKGHKELKGLDVLHFPLAFPHVFLGSRKGFDVILGNPPWEKPMVEEHAFWARHFPGLRARTQREAEVLREQYRSERPDLVTKLDEERQTADRLRALLIAGAYPGISAGHPDLYKAFVWRFWDLVSPEGGRIGVVLPRSALAAKGGDEFRRRILNQAETVDLTMLLNNREWVFPNVHPQYTIGLTAITRREGGRESELRLSGPYSSLERFRAGVRKAPVTFRAREVETWNDTASLPLLPSDESVEVFAQLRKSPRLDLNDGSGWRARPVQGDLNSTTGKPHMDLQSEECPEGFWPVYKGASFDLWAPDTGTYYAWADPERVLDHLQGKRARAGRIRRVRSGVEKRCRDSSLPSGADCLSPHRSSDGQSHSSCCPCSAKHLSHRRRAVLPLAARGRARRGVPTWHPVLHFTRLVCEVFCGDARGLLRAESPAGPPPQPPRSAAGSRRRARREARGT